MMKLSSARHYALSLPEAAEAPHFEYASFRVRGKIFVTVPPGEEYLDVFAPEVAREPALAMYPECVGKLTWGQKVVGVHVALAKAPAEVVKGLIFAPFRGARHSLLAFERGDVKVMDAVGRCWRSTAARSRMSSSSRAAPSRC
jgi:hypothetical protein